MAGVGVETSGVGDMPSALHTNQTGGSNLSYTPSGQLKRRVGAKNTEIPDTVDQDVLWEFFQTRTDFFGQVKIDKEAGFDELGEMWNSSRYLFGVIAFVMLFYNTYAIGSFNLNLLGITANHTSAKNVGCWFEEGIDASQLPNRTFLLTSAAFLQFGDKEECAKVDAIGIIACAELMLLFCFYVWAGWVIFNMVFAQSECKRWHRIANFFFNVMPMISTLSMVKLLNYVTPAVLVPELLNAIKEFFTMADGSCRLAFYIFSRIICLFAGFDAFLYKFQILANYFFQINCAGREQGRNSGACEGTSADTQGASEYDTIVYALLFVNQMLGIVQLGWFTKQRIFVFIFAGEDGAMSNKELAIKQTWEAMVCFRIQELHGWSKGMFFWLCFSDSDFQKMVLDDKDDDSGDVAEKARASLKQQPAAEGLLNQ